MKKIFLLASLFSFALLVNAQIISQYVETNSGSVPKGIEIWNNTGSTLDFATNNLVIKKGTNGAAPSADYTLSTGTLADGDVIVIGTSDMETVTTGNGATFYVYAFSFNGDDALEVWYGATKTDVFGTPNSDPGSSWDGNGVSTKNQNIALKSSINSGDTDGWTDPSERFETISTTPSTLPAGIEGFGLAPSGGTPPSVAKPTFNPAAGTYYDDVEVELSCSTGGATIYYTTNGDDPTTDATEYFSPFDITTTTTVKAAAYLAPGPNKDAGEWSDIAEATYTIEEPVEVLTIAELREALENKSSTVYNLSGEVVLTFQQSYKNIKYVQDATGGMQIVDNPNGNTNPGNITTTYSIYDGISGLIGTIGEVSGMFQFYPIADPGVASSTGNTITPATLSINEMNTDQATYESMLVTIEAAHFSEAVIGTNFITGTNYSIEDNNNFEGVFRTDFYDADYIGTPIPAGNQDITGILIEYYGTAEIVAREMADFTESTTPVIPIGSTGIMIAGLLMAAVIVIRKGRLF